MASIDILVLIEAQSSHYPSLVLRIKKKTDKYWEHICLIDFIMQVYIKILCTKKVTKYSEA